MRASALVAYRAFSDIAGKAAFFLVTVLAARALSREEFATFAIGTTLGWIAAVASDFGMQMHLARSVAREPDRAGAHLRSWLRVRVLAAAAVGAVAATAVVAWSGPERWAPLLLLTLAYLASGLVEFMYHFFRGLSRSDVESTTTLCHRGATLALAAVALSLWPGVTALAAAMLAPAAITAAYLLTKGAGDSSSAELRETLSPSAFLRDVAPIGAGVILSALYFRIDVFLLQAWRGSEAVALYNAVFRIVEALRLFPAAVLAVALPALVRAANSRPLVQVSATLTAFGAATGGALWLAAGWLVPLLYGPSFADAAPAFRVLALAFPLMSLNYALTTQLIGWNGHRTYAAIGLAALLLNVALNARLIPAMSIVGAAWATVWTEALLTVACVAALSLPRVRNPAYALQEAP